MLTSEMIKAAAKAAGADACGIGPMTRFNGAPDEMNPQFLFPEAKSVIGFVFRIPRGVQRGIEEGTQFYQYPSMAYGGINEIFAPAVLYQVGKVIEDEGYEAFVYRNTGARGVVSDMDGSPGNTLSPEEQIEVNENAKTSTAHHRSVQFTRPARKGGVAPDLQFQFRLAAVACGRECPGGCIPAINSGKTITVNLDGKICEWGDIDMWRCYAFYTHAGRYYNPFVPKEVWDKNENHDLDLMEGLINVADEHEIMKIYTALQKYFPSWVGYNMAKCGGCIRACVSMLEKKGGCMENRFHEPLRTKKAWKLDR